MQDFLLLEKLSQLDPALEELEQVEAERQSRRLIMIPSESTAPLAVRELLASSFTNIYAEGYPRPQTRTMTQEEILDYASQLGTYWRYSDPRYYKGVEYVDMVEALARRRCAEVFATEKLPAEDLFVNVQPLSGAPANNAVYTAFLEPGDVILGMNLLHGGHLTHGSPVNRSGITYNAFHYTVDPETEQLNYDKIFEIAQSCKPKIIVAGYSSYPWIPDWEKFRNIADSVGALFLADVSHIAGLIAAGVTPTPIGHAHVVTFTTHKTLCGPRGAVIISHNKEIAEKIDKGVFPGEQGGPHINSIAALALTFELAKTEAFKDLQVQTKKNALALYESLKDRGLRIPYKGTDSHIVLIDCKSVKGRDDAPLSGDLAARILDLVGIVVNRNTIPGDKSAFSASGVRLGTTWLTQRGFKEPDLHIIGNIIADVLKSTTPYYMCARVGKKIRAKIDFATMEEAKVRVRDLAESKRTPENYTQKHGYPHYFFIDDSFTTESVGFAISGIKVRSFLAYTLISDTESLKPGDTQATCLNTTEGRIFGKLTCINAKQFILTVPADKAALAGTWLQGISNAFTKYDDDYCKRIPGPVSIQITEAIEKETQQEACHYGFKPYYIGIDNEMKHDPLPEFVWEEPENAIIKRTPLNQIHKDLGAKMIPFAGWEMPVWYTSVLEEHNATRDAAGLFDVTHMGVFQAEGPDAAFFLDSVCANDIIFLRKGESCYTHFLNPHADVIDDLLVYKRDTDKYLVVVNAANEEKDWTWLNLVKDGKVCVDLERPWVHAFGRNVILRNLKEPKEGKDMRVDIALQGPKSRDILLELVEDESEKRKILRLNRTQLCESNIKGIDLTVSRTGYTGEPMCFELFVHPDDSVALWNALMEVGTPMGMLPCGLGARDSLRTEAGLPLYGHEMGGEFNLSVSEAGFLPFVKTHTPWFIGRTRFMERERERKGIVVRFRFLDKGVRMAHHADPVLDKNGKVIGKVTSCAIDSQGYLTGQAYIDTKYNQLDNIIYIFQGAPQKESKAPGLLTTGDRVTIPSPAKIVSRFFIKNS